MAVPLPAAPRPTSTDPIAVTGVGLALPGVEDVAALPGATRTAVRAAGPVQPAARLGRRGLRYLDRTSQLALCAGQDALRDATLLSADGELAVAGESVAVVASSNLGSLDTVCQVASTIAEQTTDRVSPMALPNASSNVIAAVVAMRFGLRGPNLAFTNGPTSGIDAVFWAALLVSAGRCARALVIGAETSNPVVARLLGRTAGELLDGAVAVVVERAATADDRAASQLAELGRYARRPGVAACVDQVLAGAPGLPGIWFADSRPGGTAAGPVTPRLADHDLTAAFGLASGALGVLQCAAAVGWFAAGGADAALVTAGADTDDAVAGMLLRPAGRGRR
ncbi:MAG: beta-ketoacyl synthase N-terminal-like domain-containing protein [Mycobacteriales bacterium]